jgi:hypothetical protein
MWEIGIETPIFLFWEYLFRNFGILSLQYIYELCVKVEKATYVTTLLQGVRRLPRQLPLERRHTRHPQLGHSWGRQNYTFYFNLKKYWTLKTKNLTSYQHFPSRSYVNFLLKLFRVHNSEISQY